MKKIVFILSFLLFIFIYDNFIFKDTIYNLYRNYFKNDSIKIINNKDFLQINNKNSNYYIYKENNKDIIKNDEELINKLFTIVNNGYDNYTFYCDKKYIRCKSEVQGLNDNTNIKHINDFVNTYNKYKNIQTLVYDNGKVDVHITKLYSEEDKNNLDNYINGIIDEYSINNYDNIIIKIKLFHDYLVNHSYYDEDYINNHNNGNESNKAIGPLFNHNGVCSGYTDALSIFLDKINVENIKVSNDTHVWNAVNLDNKWYYIDSTFDDPVTNTGEQYLLHDYFIIDKYELENKNDNEHFVDYEVYNFIN